MWSLVPANKLCFRAWQSEDLVVAYNALSGDTHLIEFPGFELLQLLARAPGTTEMLVAEVADLFSDGDHAELVAFIGATLLQLQRVGLVSDVSR